MLGSPFPFLHNLATLSISSPSPVSYLQLLFPVCPALSAHLTSIITPNSTLDLIPHSQIVPLNTPAKLTLGVLVVVTVINATLSASQVGVVVVDSSTEIGLVVGVVIVGAGVGVVKTTALVSVGISVRVGGGHVGEIGLGDRHGGR